MVVGGITNVKENASFQKGEEKGNFELAGSTIVLLFEKDKIKLKPELQEKLTDGQEVRIIQGEYIGDAV